MSLAAFSAAESPGVAGGRGGGGIEARASAAVISRPAFFVLAGAAGEAFGTFWAVAIAGADGAGATAAAGATLGAAIGAGAAAAGGVAGFGATAIAYGFDFGADGFA